jgi:hypothetical protein
MLIIAMACWAMVAVAQVDGPAAGKPSAAAAPVVADAPGAVAITVDCSEAPDLKEWGEKAKAVCEAWYPKIAEELRSEGFTPRGTVAIVFKPTMRVPAATGGGTIGVNAEYVRGHRDDLGMMVHELTHVVQAYPGQKADLGWLTEGIADYVRFWKYEPQVRQRKIDPEKASYKNGYRTTAAFLGWLVKAKDAAIVNKLNAKLRAGGADEGVFKDLLGKSVDELWKEFVAAGAPASPEVDGGKPGEEPVTAK